jgi:hypothetical protein
MVHYQNSLVTFYKNGGKTGGLLVFFYQNISKLVCGTNDSKHSSKLDLLVWCMMPTPTMEAKHDFHAR